jgi:NitT/TauT family transport system substrate-binding protein
VGAIALTPALFGIIVPYDSPARTLADLKGKRIGISTVGSLTQWLAFQLEKKEGWPIDNLTFITDGSTTAPQVAALTTGQVDAQVGAAAMGWNLEEQKKGRVLAPAADFVGPFLQNVIYASDTIVRDHPDEVRAFLAGWYDAVEFMATHRAETIAAENAINGFSQSVNEKQYDAVMPSQSRDGTFPSEAVAKVAQSFVELRILSAAPDMSKYLTPQFLPPHG